MTAIGFLAAAMGVASGAPLEQWHWRNPLPQGNALHNVVFANGHYVAVGEMGTILMSTDGTNWVRRESGWLDNLRDCAYGNGTFVIVGDYGTVLTSADGESWSSHYAGTFYSLNAVTFAGGEFVAVGEETAILTSPDGVNWTPRASGEWELFDIIQSEGTFVAVGGTFTTANTIGMGVILTSPDARVWTRRSIAASDPILSVAHGSGTFAAVGSSEYGWGIIWTSENGSEWQGRSSPAQSPREVFYAEGTWILVAGFHYDPDYGFGTVSASVDLEGWSVVVSNDVLAVGVTFAGSGFVAARLNGTFLTSSDGWTWADPVPQPSVFPFRALEFLNGSFVGIMDDQIAFSADGIVWSNSFTVTGAEDLVSITYGNGRYVAGGESRTVWTSLDGVNWTNPAPNVGNSSQKVAVAYGNGIFVGASGSSADILTSSDAMHWTLQQLETNEYDSVYFRDITFGNDRFVAVADRAIAVSADGTNWLYSREDDHLGSVASGNGRFVAVGYNQIMTSTDGTNWITLDSPEFGWLQDVAFGGGFFVTVGIDSLYSTWRFESPIWISTDGIHWFRRSSKTPKFLSLVTFGDGSFFVAGGGGLLQSDPLVSLSLFMQPNPQLSLSGPIHRTYRIECTDDLSGTNWTPLVTTTNCGTMEISDTTWTNGGSRFYRAVLLP